MQLRKQMLTAALGLAIVAMHAVAQSAASRGTFVYIGTESDSINLLRLDPATGHLVYIGQRALFTRPTWQAVDPGRPILYSVSEIGDYDQQTGVIYSFAIDPNTGALKQLSAVSSEGHGPTFLSYDARVNALFVANYGRGRVVAIPVQADGSLGEATSFQTDYGRAQDTAKPTLARAHEAILDPGGHFVLAPDIGTDRIFLYKYDAVSGSLSPAATPYFETGAGTGPRHLVFSADGRFVYVLMELSAEIRVLSWDSTTGQLHPMQSISVDQPNFKGIPSAAEIRISADGRFVYTSNRATNSIQVFAVDQSAGTLSRIQDIPAGGESPRSFAIDPSGRWLLVANQQSNTVTVLAVDQQTGKLSATGDPIKAGLSPLAVSFYQP